MSRLAEQVYKQAEGMVEEAVVDIESEAEQRHDFADWVQVGFGFLDRWLVVDT